MFAGLVRMLGWLPDRLAFAFADLMVPVFVFVTWIGRKRATRHRRGFHYNVRVVFRDRLDARQRRALLWRWARYMTHFAVELVKMGEVNATNLHRFVDIPEESLARVRALVAQGKGLIALTGHIGAYEYSAHLVQVLGFSITSVFRESPIRPVTDVINTIRGTGGQVMTERRGAVREMMRALRAGEMMGLLADVSSKESLVFTPFLGTPAATNTTFGLLHLKTGAPIVVATIERLRPRRFAFHIWEVIEHAPTDDRHADLVAIATRVNQALSKAIQARPEQWFWDARRFRTRPDGEQIGADGLPPQTAPEQVPTLHHA
ncbi:MAG: lysophospholipid acyltransferase family protein [Planctomycetes bacterium]|nr:lysophospholipid acyltransferase family protein [Planctomycetota bacterium]MCB9870064.1 lysophospholipid acyltransferase family protein [Planctomycetota bacterium]MCB9889499.1 lysophospholipid acyltransferase family protein [Planctomycetota bacterium]